MLPEDPGSFLWFIKAALYSTFAAFGGLLGHLFRSLEAGNKVTIYASCIKSGGAAFAGFIVFLLCNAFEFDPQWTGVIVGVFGWLGADVTMVAVEKLIMGKLHISLEKTAPEKAMTEKPTEDFDDAG